MPRLGVNIDHIATLREARKVSYPDPIESLYILKECQVDQVTIHLREDRRHIRDHDLARISKISALPVNLEMAVANEMIDIAIKAHPHTVTMVPENRAEISTEGGLDCVARKEAVRSTIQRLVDANIRVSLFIDPDETQATMARELGAQGIEIHTGTYCNVIEKYYERTGSYDYSQDVFMVKAVATEVDRIKKCTAIAKSLGLKVFAGHGLHRYNLAPIVAIRDIEEYNIGHAIIARSVFVGLKQAVLEIQKELNTQ